MEISVVFIGLMYMGMDYSPVSSYMDGGYHSYTAYEAKLYRPIARRYEG